MTKADVWSLGMLLVKLICYTTGENFGKYSILNQLENKEDYTNVVWDIINLCEKHGLSKEAQILVQMFDKDLNERLHIDKLIQLFKTKFGFESIPANVEYIPQKHNLKKKLTPGNGYLKNVKFHLKSNFDLFLDNYERPSLHQKPTRSQEIGQMQK
jgi:hypothetical protein